MEGIWPGIVYEAPAGDYAAAAPADWVATFGGDSVTLSYIPEMLVHA